MHTESDEDLVKRIASADRLAMKVLFSRHQTRVYRFALRLLRDETMAEDVTGDVFMDLWRQAEATPSATDTAVILRSSISAHWLSTDSVIRLIPSLLSKE